MGRKKRDELADREGRTFADRLRVAMEHAKLPADDGGTALALKLAGGLRRQTTHQWLNGTIPEVKAIVRIGQRLGVDCIWLVTGEGEMLPIVQRITPVEREAVHICQRLSEERRQQWIGEGYRLEQQEREIRPTTPPQVVTDKEAAIGRPTAASGRRGQR